MPIQLGEAMCSEMLKKRMVRCEKSTAKLVINY